MILETYQIGLIIGVSIVALALAIIAIFKYFGKDKASEDTNVECPQNNKPETYSLNVPQSMTARQLSDALRKLRKQDGALNSQFKGTLFEGNVSTVDGEHVLHCS